MILQIIKKIIFTYFFLAIFTPHAYSQQEIVFGVYAYRPHTIMYQRYQPLINYLNQQLPDYKVKLDVLELDEFDTAINSKAVDFIFTNPRHYILLRSKNVFFGAIATVLKKPSENQKVRYLGGVIFTLKDTPIQYLSDLIGKKIAIPSKKHMGGFQTQAMELFNAGIDIDDDIEFVLSGSHNQVVQDVYSGKADVGFVRTEILEELAQQNKLRLDELTIINKKEYSGFPYIISTQRYPEWPVLALQHLDYAVISKLAAALLLLDENHPAAMAAGIAGFTPPADYFPVEEVARTLRIPPYDNVLLPTMSQLWEQYKVFLILVVSFLGIIIILLIVLLRQNRKLYQSEKLKQLILNAVPEMIWLKSADGRYLLSNPMFARLCGKNPEDIVKCKDSDLFPEKHAKDFSKNDYLVFEQGVVCHDEITLSLPDENTKKLLEITKTPLKDQNNNIIGVLGFAYDITERRLIEEQQRIISSVFINSHQGIFITSAENKIIDINPAACRLTGYSREELLGKSPSMLKSGKQGPLFYKKMWEELKLRGKWSGELYNRKKSGEIYTELMKINVIYNEPGQIQCYIAMFSDITDLKQYQQQLEYIAYNDSLTSLPNRLLLADRLEQALSLAERQNKLVAIVYLDLDGFKAINDNYGHDAGDLVLVKTAERLKITLRNEDTVARLGGDEFVLLIVNLQAIGELEDLLSRIINVINQPIPINDSITVSVSASMGISLSHFDESPPEALMRHADYAMYQAKKQGKNQYCFYQSDRFQEKSEQIRFQDSIRTALMLHQFVLFYQPKVNMYTGKVIGFEALIRWLHPEKGLTSPGYFLPQIMNNSSLIIDIGNWVLEQTFKQQSHWEKNGIEYCVSVNIDAVHLQNIDFIKKLKSLKKQYPNVKPENIELELLESVAVENFTQTIDILKQCKEEGFKLALDDFGSGYSSLNYLKQLPVDTIKIDRMFIKSVTENSEDVAILRATVKLCHSLDKALLAEGVETISQGKLLLSLGCQQAQGYKIGHPMPESEALVWLKQWKSPEQWSQYRFIDLGETGIAPLHIAIQHNKFIVQVIEAVKSNSVSLFPEHVEDSTRCQFGQWLLQQEKGTFSQNELYVVIVNKHQEVHRIAFEIYELLKCSKQEEIEQKCQLLLDLHNDIVHLLVQLYLKFNLLEFKVKF